MAKNYYPEEFRRKAVDLYESTPEQTMQEIATDLGISRSALDTWVAKYGTGQRAPATPTATTTGADTPEITIRRLAWIHRWVGVLRVCRDAEMPL